MTLAQGVRNVFYRPARRVYAWLGRLFNERFERRLGVETSQFVTLEEMGLDGENRTDYEPSSWLTLRRVLSARDVSENDVFLDFGCGKGRVLLQAAAYPFKRVIGVDISPELIAAARANCDRALPKLRCKNIELVAKDVIRYEVPDDLTVAYFYNPFSGDLFAAVIDKLIASLRRRPRQLRIIYNSPREEQVLLRAGATLIKVSQRPSEPDAPPLESSLRMYVFPPPESAGDGA